MPSPRRASYRRLRNAAGETLDQALLLWFPGPATATGEDLAELHLHGGRAVVRRVMEELLSIPACRAAEPGEFTRRALSNGRIDLAEAEGLADLLSAETERQRRQAQALAGGALSATVGQWQTRLTAAAAQIEALLDFADEDDVALADEQLAPIVAEVDHVRADMQALLEQPAAERLRDGLLVVIAGPPNAGKSTLINALAQQEVAIVSPLAGTTRDVVEVPLALDGIPFRFADTAGLRDVAGDAIEAIGIARAAERVAGADLLLWLGDPAEAPQHPALIRIAAQADRHADEPNWQHTAGAADVRLSALTGEGMDTLHRLIVDRARDLLPAEGMVAINARQRDAIAGALGALTLDHHGDALLLADSLRLARHALGQVTGQGGTEAMLDALFGRFCIGK